MTILTTLVRVVKDTSEAADDAGCFNHDRDTSAVLMHLVEEVGEVALEISIENGTSYKKASEDGVVGEAIDVIINALDLIHVHSPELTEKDLIAIAHRKCDKWLLKVTRTDLVKK